MVSCTGPDCPVCFPKVSNTEAKERIRKARNELEPLVSGTGKQFGKEINEILNKLAKLEA